MTDRVLREREIRRVLQPGVLARVHGFRDAQGGVAPPVGYNPSPRWGEDAAKMRGLVLTLPMTTSRWS